MSTIYEIELPAAYLDELVEDAAVGVVGATPTLINQDPTPSEQQVPGATLIGFDLATVAATGTVDLSATIIYVNGNVVFNAGFVFGFWTESHSNPQADVLRILLTPPTPFESESTVTVRVVSKAVGDAGVLDTTYTFKIADTTAPRMVSAQAVELQTVRVTFSEAVLETDAANAASALHPDNWSLDRLGDYITPVVSANVVSVQVASAESVYLTTDIPLTPNGNYRVTATALEDRAGNAIAAPFNTTDFLGWAPPVPEGRDLDLYKRLPSVNRREDDSLDLLRFMGCLQEVLGLLLYDVDRFTDILDPDTAPEEYVDAMLADLGNPFAFDLTLIDKRRLAQVLVDMYQLKGTRIGIINVVRFFLGLEVTIDSFNVEAGWILGDSELGEDTVLGTSDIGLLYSFVVTVAQVLTDAQRAQLRDIVEYMKPAHTHFARLDEPFIPEVIDHLELGLSELGENWILH